MDIVDRVYFGRRRFGAVKNARLMDLLVPCWILVFLNSEKFPKASDWRMAQQDFTVNGIRTTRPDKPSRPYSHRM
jgi:hypothetical protein